MILKASSLPEKNGRKPYPVEGYGFPLVHFVARTATKDKPFRPHKHPQNEIWFVLEGEGFYYENGTETEVSTGDMMLIAPWDEHGLRTESEIRWLCLG